MRGRRRATGRVRRLAEHSLLLQHAPLDAISAGLGTSMRAAGIRLGDVLHRLQPSLKVIVVVCDPAARVRSLTQGTGGGALLKHRDEFEKCTAHGTSASTCAARVSAADTVLIDGAYSLWMRELLRALPASQLRMLRAEDLRDQPANATAEALAFLALAPHPAVAKAARAAAVTRRPAGHGAAAEQSTRSPVSALGALEERLGRRTAMAGFYDAFDAELVHLMDGDERFAFRARGA